MSRPVELDAEDAASAAAVAGYLQAHPEFFTQHPALLVRLELPIAGGPVVSLVERQLAGLRAEHERLRGRFATLVALAQHHEALEGRVHRLVLDLLDTPDPQAIFDLLTRRLAAEFQADRVTALLFASPAARPGGAAREFVGAASPRRDAFATLLASSGPQCGRLTEVQCEALFGADVFSGSHVVLPLLGNGWDGLLVVSSHNPVRFEPTMGTELLSFLRDVMLLALRPWVAEIGGRPGVI
ncbi:MAG: DUF484 family protein [Gammaproteobacteria bacterium]|nr:DUF484 family protein [Gammaproteobacteria bacterium]